jgi:hypothetical protein
LPLALPKNLHEVYVENFDIDKQQHPPPILYFDTHLNDLIIKH